MRSAKRILVAAAALLAAGCFAAPAAVAAYPEKPVKLIVPFATGGATDAMARLLAQRLSDKFGQRFYVENIVDEDGGKTGMGNVARSPGDGYTILIASSSYMVCPIIHKRCPYDAFKDFIPVTLAAVAPNVLIVNPTIAAATAQELIALIKANPHKYVFSSPGPGTTPYLASEMFKTKYKLDYAISDYEGSRPATAAVVGGVSQMSFVAITPTIQMAKTGKLRALAVTTPQRSSALPEVPTLAEIGISEMESETMQGVLVPKGTPKDVVDRLQREIAAIVAMPEVKATMAPLGLEPKGSSSAEFAAYVKAEADKWSKVIVDTKIKQIR